MKIQCFKEFLRYSSLSVLGMLGLSFYILADTYFISGWLGAQGLAALNLAIPVYSLVHGSGLMIGMGGATLYTISRSRNDKEQGDAAFTAAFVFWGLLSAVFMAAGLCFSDEITVMLGADDDTFAMSHIYLQMLLVCSPVFLLNDMLLAFVRNDGAPQLAMAGMLAGSLSNIVLDYVFVYLMQWGMFGAVFATCLAPVISMCVLSVFFLRKKNGFHLSLKRPDIRLSTGLLIVGFPSLVTEFSSGIVIIVFNLLMLQFAGNTGVAAYGIIANISLVVIAVFTGVAQGIQPILSRHFGCGEILRLKLTLRYALWSVVLLSVCIYGFIFFGAGWIARVFNAQGDMQLQDLAVQGLRLYFLGTLFAGLNIVLCMYFTSTERPKEGNAVSLLRGLVLILPLAFLLAAWMGITGLWLAFAAAELLTIAAAVLLLCKRRKSAF